MKKNILKYLKVLFLILLVLNVGTTAFAAENEFYENSATYANYLVKGDVASNGYIDLYPRLESYIGLNKNIIINATSESSSGGLLLYLYNPDGELKSYDWIMGVNETAQWTLFLPSSGEWRLRVYAQGTTASVRVSARWE